MTPKVSRFQILKSGDERSEWVPTPIKEVSSMFSTFRRRRWVSAGISKIWRKRYDETNGRIYQEL